MPLASSGEWKTHSLDTRMLYPSRISHPRVLRSRAEEGDSSGARSGRSACSKAAACGVQSSLHLRFFNFSFSPSASPSRSELTNPCIGIPGRAASRSNRSGACSAPSLGLGAPRCSRCSPAPSARAGKEGKGGPNLCSGLRRGHGAGGPHIIAPQPAHGPGLLGHRSLFGEPSAPHQALMCTSTSPCSPKCFPLAASPHASPLNPPTRAFFPP